MLDELKKKLEEAKKRATRLRKSSETADEAERQRDADLYNLLDAVHGITVAIPKLPMRDRWNVLGKKYAPFGTRSQFPGLVLQRVAPELDVKKRAKYAAVLRYVAARKVPSEPMKDFVRKNGGINGCDTKERKLRMSTATGHKDRKR